ncbi:MAG TPA: hypothetical protein VMT55_05675 [Candidatus Sulfotelmatobacter sp.]|nr:hypothetical protein [Candidatus Sulfotelmatobacter sp.]
MIEVPKISDQINRPEIEILQSHNANRRCIYYKEELCAAPKCRFAVCNKCSRIDPKLITKSLFDKIMELAKRLLDPNVQGLG